MWEPLHYRNSILHFRSVIVSQLTYPEHIGMCWIQQSLQYVSAVTDLCMALFLKHGKSHWQSSCVFLFCKLERKVKCWWKPGLEGQGNHSIRGHFRAYVITPCRTLTHSFYAWTSPVTTAFLNRSYQTLSGTEHELLPLPWGFAPCSSPASSSALVRKLRHDPSLPCGGGRDLLCSVLTPQGSRNLELPADSGYNTTNGSIQFYIFPTPEKSFPLQLTKPCSQRALEAAN